MSTQNFKKRIHALISSRVDDSSACGLWTTFIRPVEHITPTIKSLLCYTQLMLLVSISINNLDPKRMMMYLIPQWVH